MGGVGTMKRNTRPFSRRTLLKTIGGSVVVGSTYAGAVGANRSSHLIAVDPSSLVLAEGETGEVTVEIQGPPFGRTDVEVVGHVPATPEAFRLSGRGATQVVELKAVEGTAEFHATLPRGDEQVVTVDVELADPLLDETAADTVIPVREFGAPSSEAQYDALESIDLSDPFTLAVEAPNLTEQQSYDYGVTTYFDAVGESPSNRASQPGVPLAFDERGIASVSIGSPGVDADVNAWWDVRTINNIEVPAGATRMAVETE